MPPRLSPTTTDDPRRQALLALARLIVDDHLRKVRGEPEPQPDDDVRPDEIDEDFSPLEAA